MKVVVDDKIPFLRGVLEPFCEVNYLPGDKIDNSSVKDADAILTRTRTKCDEKLLEGSKVTFIGSATIGYDHIDTAYCEKSGIYWTNAPGCNSSSVLQYVGAALMEIANTNKFCLNEKTLGIVGVGNVGSKVERFARAMGMKVLLNDPPRQRSEGGNKFVPLDELLLQSDIITLHVPLNRTGQDKTFHLIDSDNFSNMRKGAWLINTSRGEVVNTQTLKTSLKSGQPSGIVLDVWENEPKIDLGLLNDAYISTPHIAGYSVDGKANGTAFVVNALSDFFGLPLRNWYPRELPEGNRREITIECADKGNSEIVLKAIRHTYDILGDSVKLVKEPSLFEYYRGNYGVRREFGYYTVKLSNCGDKVGDTLSAIGFNVE